MKSMSKKRKRKTPRRKAQHPFIASAMAIDRRQAPERRAMLIYGRKMSRIVHTVKCWPSYYKPIVAGEKPFDVRKGNDRQYEAGHYLDLQEWNPDTETFTGFHSLREITYVMHGAPFLPKDTWVLGLSRECYNP